MRLPEVLLVLSASGLVLVDSAYQPVCNTTDDYNQRLPSLPNQLSTTVEANFAQYNESILVTEYYDEPGNRGKIEYVTSNFRGMAIFDYNQREVFLIPDYERNASCGVRLLGEGPPSRIINDTFGISSVNGSVFIGSLIFARDSNKSALYIGTEMVRGILCNRWQTCHVEPNISYTLDYYFAVNSWDYLYNGDDAVLVQIRLNGTSDTRTLSHVYSFIDFNTGPDAVPDSVFAIPAGLPCLGRISGKELPEVPPFFSMYIEAVEERDDNIRTFQEFYDNDLFRFDILWNNTPYSIIHDFGLDVYYIIDTHTNNCTVGSLEDVDYLFDVITGPNGTAELRSPTELFRIGSGYNFSYEGFTTIRGIEAEAWISIRESTPLSRNVTLVDGTVELFYSLPGQNIISTFSNTSNPSPLAVKVNGTRVYYNRTSGSWDNRTYLGVYNIFHFSADEPSFDVFDTSLCSPPGQSRILTLIIPGRELGTDLGQLRRGIRIGLTKWAQIPPLQLANIEVVGENGTHIFATLQITTLPSIARYPNPRSADSILDSILEATSSDGELPFTIDFPTGDPVRPFLLEVDPDCPFTPPTNPPSSDSPTSCPSCSSGYPTGTLSGVAIGTFIFGTLFGLTIVGVLLFFCSRKRNLPSISTVAYKRQEDELKDVTD